MQRAVALVVEAPPRLFLDGGVRPRHLAAQQSALAAVRGVALALGRHALLGAVEAVRHVASGELPAHLLVDREAGHSHLAVRELAKRMMSSELIAKPMSARVQMIWRSSPSGADWSSSQAISKKRCASR